MNKLKTSLIPLLTVFLLLGGSALSGAEVLIQCPGDLNGDSIPDPYLFNNNGKPTGRPNPDYDPGVKCMHVGAGDGFITMADGRPMYMFGFSDVTGIPQDMAMDAGMLAATFPAPNITVDEGDKFYLNLTNAGMVIRPDLFDPHTVHWHGFPQAAPVFDGVPDASISINMGFTLTYFYNVVDPGTYMYHCHVEATEHMQMGMLGNLYVRPAQNRLPNGTLLGTRVHSNPDYNLIPGLDDPLVGDKYAYNDGDGSTYYDVDYPIQIGSFDSEFHDASETVQPLPFAAMKDDYPMLNGRGYPDTINPGFLVPPARNGEILNATEHNPTGVSSQKLSTLIQATSGQKVLLRISNLNVTRFYTLATLGIPMKVVGHNAKLLRGPDGKSLYYTTNSITMGGGEALDAIIEIPATATPGTRYFLYTANLNYLSNGTEDFGGMMTEIRVY